MCDFLSLALELGAGALRLYSSDKPGRGEAAAGPQRWSSDRRHDGELPPSEKRTLSPLHDQRNRSGHEKRRRNNHAVQIPTNLSRRLLLQGYSARRRPSIPRLSPPFLHTFAGHRPCPWRSVGTPTRCCCWRPGRSGCAQRSSASPGSWARPRTRRSRRRSTGWRCWRRSSSSSSSTTTWRRSTRPRGRSWTSWKRSGDTGIALSNHTINTALTHQPYSLYPFSGCLPKCCSKYFQFIYILSSLQWQGHLTGISHKAAGLPLILQGHSLQDEEGVLLPPPPPPPPLSLQAGYPLLSLATFYLFINAAPSSR